jgi:hypothetical protein
MELSQARALVSAGEDEAAKRAYLTLLQAEPAQLAALLELGALAWASGHRSAARTLYRQAVACHPDVPVAHARLGDVLAEAGEAEGAIAAYRRALAVDGGLAEAHRGLARVLTERGEEAGMHWACGFVGHATVVRSYRGRGAAVQVLLLVSAHGGNIPVRHWLPDRVFAVTAMYVEYVELDAPLPPHDVVVNAVGDADCCGEALALAACIAGRSCAAVVNPPARVCGTGRAEMARRLAGVPGIVVPGVQEMTRAALLASEDLRFPLLVRSPGFHSGRRFCRVAHQADLAAAVAGLPGERLLAIEYLDARGADGMARKYRVMFVDGVAYPLHLAISGDWKVHYFTAAMEGEAAYRAEEQGFLEDMPGVLGAQGVAAVQGVGQALGLDYAGVDFALRGDGAVMVFEANATMVVNPPPPGEMWDYRRGAVEAVLAAMRGMVVRRAAG